MLGSHRERNPSRSENWHRRTTIYILLPRRVISSSSSHPSRIPRNSAAGDWRWRPRALRDKPHQHTPGRTSAATNPHEYTSSSSRPRNFRRYGRKGGRVGEGYIKSIKYGSNHPHVPFARWLVEYLDTNTTSADTRIIEIPGCRYM